MKLISGIIVFTTAGILAAALGGCGSAADHTNSQLQNSDAAVSENVAASGNGSSSAISYGCFCR